MKHALYHDLVAWYPLLDPLEDHGPECAEYEQALRSVLGPGRHSLLELGAGAGHNGFFLKRSFECTLSDLSPAMLERSVTLNPECPHVLGDMRELRLGRSFDAVFVHDAIVYMLSEAELRAAAQTAFVHTRPGGAALFAPDTLREVFVESSALHEGEAGERALRCLEWSWDPDANDDQYRVDYSLLLREGQALRAVHDTHFEGLFSKATWLRILSEVGYEMVLAERSLVAEADGHGYTTDVFLCRRPHTRA